MKAKVKKQEEEVLNPITKSRKIVEHLIPICDDNREYMRMLLHTAICHGLESKEIDKLYKLVKKEENG